VLRLLTAGRSTRQVANLYPKIGAHCRAEATAYALRHGLA
jgi:DNA-binding NarL/FixJ family response regulator